MHFYWVVQQVQEYQKGKTNYIPKEQFFEQFKQQFPNYCLLPIELYETALKNKRKELVEAIKVHLELVKQNRPNMKHLINDGLRLAHKH